jgi:hypothetical protein
MTPPQSWLLALVLLCGALAQASPFPQVRAQAAKDAEPPGIVVEGKLFPPILFAGNNQFGRDDVLLEQIQLAARQGVPLFSFNLGLPWHQDDATFLATLDRFTAANPEGYFLVRIWMGPSAAWLAAHPDDALTDSTGRKLGMASLASAAWRAEAAAQLRQRLVLLSGHPSAGRFLGVLLAYLNTGEWFPPETDAYCDYSLTYQTQFSAFLARERLDPALPFPTPSDRERTAWGPFRDPHRDQAAVAATRFASALTAEVIGEFAQVVKDATDGRSLAGVFYGYTFELNHNGPRALTHSGHLALGRVLQNPHVDFISAPYAYFERSPGEPGHFHLPLDSAALAGKLVLLEDDTYTHLARTPEPTVSAPGWNTGAADLAESLTLVQRNAALFSAHRVGWWYFDLLSDGRWKDPQLWGAAQPYIRTLFRPIAFAPEVAFLPSEDAVAYMADTTHPELLASLALWRHELGRLPRLVGYYLQSDLPRLPAAVRLAILPNAYRITEAEGIAAETFVARGGTLVWTFAAGIAASETTAETPLDAARAAAAVSRCTGFPVEALAAGPASFTLEGGTTVYGDPDAVWRGRFSVADGAHEVLARYSDNGAVCTVQRAEGRGRVLYTAVPRLPVDLLSKMLAAKNE